MNSTVDTSEAPRVPRRYRVARVDGVVRIVDPESGWISEAGFPPIRACIREAKRMAATFNLQAIGAWP